MRSLGALVVGGNGNKRNKLNSENSNIIKIFIILLSFQTYL